MTILSIPLRDLYWICKGSSKVIVYGVAEGFYVWFSYAFSLGSYKGIPKSHSLFGLA